MSTFASTSREEERLLRAMAGRSRGPQAPVRATWSSIKTAPAVTATATATATASSPSTSATSASSAASGGSASGSSAGRPAPNAVNTAFAASGSTGASSGSSAAAPGGGFVGAFDPLSNHAHERESDSREESRLLQTMQRVGAKTTASPGSAGPRAPGPQGRAWFCGSCGSAAKESDDSCPNCGSLKGGRGGKSSDAPAPAAAVSAQSIPVNKNTATAAAAALVVPASSSPASTNPTAADNLAVAAGNLDSLLADLDLAASAMKTSATALQPSPSNREPPLPDEPAPEPYPAPSQSPIVSPDLHAAFFHPCHACTQNIVGGFRGILERQYHESCFACAECGKVLGEECYLEEDTSADLRCHDCFFRKFECQFCHKLVEGDFLIEKDKLYHAVCMAARCDSCMQTIVGDSGMIRAMGKQYHPHCFVCSSCQASITGAYHESSGTPVCVSCYGKSQDLKASSNAADASGTCPVCRTSVAAGGGAMQLQGRVYHIKCFNCNTCARSLASGDEVGVFIQDGVVLCSTCKSSRTSDCARCHKALTGRFLELADGEKLHEACHKCDDCSVSLSGASYIVKSGRSLCSACGALPICAGCRGSVAAGGYLEIESDVYHAACFVCTDCRRSLIEGDSVSYHEKAGKPYCSTCI